MVAYIIVSIAGGLLFGFMDGLINANPYAENLFAPMKPIRRERINIIAGFLIDLAYGFLMAGIFLVLYPVLPGGSGIVKGISYSLILWFFRVVMSALSQWMMYSISFKTVIYMLWTGLAEMAVLGVLYGISFRSIQ